MGAVENNVETVMDSFIPLLLSIFYRTQYGTEPHPIQDFLIQIVLAMALEYLSMFHSPVTTLSGPCLTNVPEAGRHIQQGTDQILLEAGSSDGWTTPVPLAGLSCLQN